MKLSRPAKIGALCWTAAAPLFLVANAVTGLGWHNPPYSWATNNISDLGNVRCGIWDTTRPRYVCSPWHSLMNVSLLFALAGAYPADVNENLHFLAAVLILVMGNIGLPLAGLAPRATALARFRVLTLAAGITALAGSTLFFAQQSMGIGVGAMERVAGFPFVIWASCVGAILLANARRRPALQAPGQWVLSPSMAEDATNLSRLAMSFGWPAGFELV